MSGVGVSDVARYITASYRRSGRRVTVKIHIRTHAADTSMLHEVTAFIPRAARRRQTRYHRAARCCYNERC